MSSLSSTVSALFKFRILFKTASFMDSVQSFTDFKVKHNKIYQNSSVELCAIKNFANNLRIILRQNLFFQNNRSTFESNLWKYSDLCSKDFQEKGLFGFIGHPQIKQGLVSFPNINIPENLNYTAKGLVTKVLFQGYCGSCWYAKFQILSIYFNDS